MKSYKKITAIVLMLMLVISSFIVMPANAITTKPNDNTESQYSVATPDEAVINTDIAKKKVVATKAVSEKGSNYLFMYYFQTGSAEQIVFTQNTTTNNTAFADKKKYTFNTYSAYTPIELFLIGSKKISETSSYAAALKEGYVPAFCVYPGTRIDYTFNPGYKLSNFNNYYNSLKPSIQKALKTLSAASIPGKYNIDSGSTNEKEAAFATQLLYWEFITGHRSTNNRTTQYYSKTDCNFSKRINNIGTVGNVKVADIQKYYDEIVAEMKRIIKSESAKGRTYDADEGSDYDERMGDVDTYDTTKKAAFNNMEKKGIIGRYNKSSTTSYKYVYYATVNNYFNEDGSRNYNGSAIIDSDGKVVNGSGKKIIMSGPEKTGSNNTTAKFTIKSKKSIEEYKGNYYFTFKQKAPSITGLFGANYTADNTWQNVAVRFPYAPKQFYARLYSKPIPVIGGIKIQKTCRQGTEEEYKSMDEAEEGWYFKVEGDGFGSNGTVIGTNDKGFYEKYNLPLNETYKVTELGRLYTGNNADEDLEKSPAPVKINGKTYGFPIGWKPAEKDRASKLIKSKTITEEDPIQSFKYTNYYGKQEFRVEKIADDGDVDGYYFQVYDYDYVNDPNKTKHIKKTIVGPTNENGLTDAIRVSNIGTFNVGVKELGKYVSGDKTDVKSYKIPDKYDKPEGDVVEEISPNTSDDDAAEEIPVITVHNICSGKIQVQKSGVLSGKNYSKPVSGAVYGIYREKIFAFADTEEIPDEENVPDEEFVPTEDETDVDDEEIDGIDDDTDSGEYETEPEQDENTNENPDNESDNVETKDVAVTDRLTDRNGNLIQKLTTGKDGLSELSEALPLGTYYVQEISAPDGTYLSDDIFEVTITAKTNTVENPNVEVVKATDEYTYVEFYKVDAKTGKVLMTSKDADVDVSKITFIEGAKIQLYDDTDNKLVKEWVSGNSKVEFIGELKVGHSYRFHEESAPKGYIAAQDISFTIPEKASEVTVNNRRFVMIDDQTVFTKTDLSGENELEGAKIEVRDKTGKIVDEWVSEKTAHIIQNLVAGESYTLKEVVAPDGYVLSTSEIAFVAGEGDSHLTMKDACITFTKYDATGENELEDATIEVTDKDGNVIDSWISTTEPHFIKNLVEGQEYTLTETIAPEGCVRNSESIKFVAGKENQNLSMKNTKVTFTKTDITGEKELEGAGIVVKDKDGKIVDKWISTTEPHIIKGLVTGQKYFLTETVAPKGYTLNSSTIEFEAQKDKDQHITMKDTYVDFTKTDITGKEELEGAKIVVKDKDGNIVDKWTSTKKAHIIKGLVTGQKYSLIETVAPKGYNRKSEAITFVVSDKENQHIEMKDTITVLKKTDANNKPLAGAKIQILNSKGNKVIYEFTSTTEPELLEGLVEGEEYIIHEKEAPKGYQCAPDKKFTVKKDENTYLGFVNIEQPTKTSSDVTPWMFGFASVACVAGAILFLLIIKRKKTTN